jgi:phosphoribosyl-ATP pyrophosphohydrolase/phosphoribosyl-AMP cyclohydrolase
MTDFLSLKFDEKGLIPAVVQDAQTGRVLMVAYMDREALQKTIDGPDTWFFSRSRNKLWHKGETSGSFLRVREVRADCDGDTVLVQAEPQGPVCHTGNETCFFGEPLAQHEAAGPVATPQVLADLFRIIKKRQEEMPEGSYTARLFKEGTPRIAQKVVEEAGEVAIAAVAQESGGTVTEAADLLYHTLVLLAAKGVNPADVWAELARRRK